jgi:hypothetical protein
VGIAGTPCPNYWPYSTAGCLLWASWQNERGRTIVDWREWGSSRLGYLEAKPGPVAPPGKPDDGQPRPDGQSDGILTQGTRCEWREKSVGKSGTLLRQPFLHLPQLGLFRDGTHSSLKNRKMFSGQSIP